MQDLSFSQKIQHAGALQDPTHIPADRRLLQQYMPDSELLARPSGTNATGLSNEIVYELLDYVSPEQIVANRQQRSATMMLPSDPVPAPVSEKKNGKKKMNTLKFVGKSWIMKRFKKLISCITTVSIPTGAWQKLTAGSMRIPTRTK